MSNAIISIVPWPSYDEFGRPWWTVKVQCTKGRFSLGWTTADGGRWSRSSDLKRVGKTLWWVEKHVRESVTEDPKSVTNAGLQRDSAKRDSVTVSRAQETYGGCHAVTVAENRDTAQRDSSHDRDSDSPPLRYGTVTITGHAEQHAKQKARLAADPRFAAWAASAGPMAEPVDPDPVASEAIKRRGAYAEEHVELRRIAAVRALELHARMGHLDADDLADARHWASKQALVRPMGEGAP